MAPHAPTHLPRPPDPSQTTAPSITHNYTAANPNQTSADASTLNLSATGTVQQIAAQSPLTATITSDINQQNVNRTNCSPTTKTPTHQNLANSNHEKISSDLPKKPDEPSTTRDGVPTVQTQQSQRQNSLQPPKDPFPKLTSNFYKHKSSTKGAQPTVRHNATLNSAPPPSVPNASASPNVGAPAHPNVIPTFASKLRSTQGNPHPPIQLQPAIIDLVATSPAVVASTVLSPATDTVSTYVSQAEAILGTSSVVIDEAAKVKKIQHDSVPTDAAAATTCSGKVPMIINDSAQHVEPCADKNKSESTKEWILKSFYGNKQDNEKKGLLVAMEQHTATHLIDVPYEVATDIETPDQPLLDKKIEVVTGIDSVTIQHNSASNGTATGKKKKRKHDRKPVNTEELTEEEVLKAKKLAFWDAILAKSCAENPILDSKNEHLHVLENKAADSIPSQDNFDHINEITRGRDKEDIENDKALAAYVSPAQSRNQLIPTARLEVICKKASKAIKEVGRGFFPATSMPGFQNEVQDTPTYFLGDLFDDSHNDQITPSKDGKSKWNLNAPLFIPNALRQQEPQHAIVSDVSQDGSKTKLPYGQSDEVLLQRLDLYDIQGLLQRQNSPPQDLPQKFSSPHPGIIEDGSEYEDEDEESTAYNFMVESRHVVLSPRLEHVRKPKMIKKKRRPLEPKEKEDAPERTKRVQPTRSSKSRSSRRQCLC